MAEAAHRHLVAPEEARQVLLNTYSRFATSDSLVAEAMYPPDALMGPAEAVQALSAGFPSSTTTVAG